MEHELQLGNFHSPPQLSTTLANMLKYKLLGVAKDGLQDSINCLSFSFNGQMLAVGTHDCKAHIYDTSSRVRLVSLVGTSAVTALLWHPSVFSLFIGFASGNTYVYHFAQTSSADMVKAVMNRPGDAMVSHISSSILKVPLLTLDFITQKSLVDVDGIRIPHEPCGPIEDLAFDGESRGLAILTGGRAILCRFTSQGEHHDVPKSAYYD